jgi:hypothetical protein
VGHVPYVGVQFAQSDRVDSRSLFVYGDEKHGESSGGAIDLQFGVDGLRLVPICIRPNVILGD